MKKLLWLAWFLIAIGFALNVHAYTPKERARLKVIRSAVMVGIEHGKAVEAAAEQARIEAANANLAAKLATDSAIAAGDKAKTALDEAARCKKENDEMRPIVKAVTGPWWFPGLNALIYGAKKSFLSLIVIILIVFVLFVAIKIIITVTTGGTVTAGLGAVGRMFGKLGRWFGRALKKAFSFLSRKGQGAEDKFLTRTEDIAHRTIGSDPPPKPPPKP